MCFLLTEIQQEARRNVVWFASFKNKFQLVSLGIINIFVLKLLYCFLSSINGILSFTWLS